MTDILESMRRIFVPIHREGYPFIVVGLILARGHRAAYREAGHMTAPDQGQTSKKPLPSRGRPHMTVESGTS
ncbi:MAG TPA: hypothetical protein VF601_04850 [Beijerinckiaceae bacterium]